VIGLPDNLKNSVIAGSPYEMRLLYDSKSNRSVPFWWGRCVFTI